MNQDMSKITYNYNQINKHNQSPYLVIVFIKLINTITK